MVCEIFCWRDVTACYTMTYSAKDFDVFVIFFEREVMEDERVTAEQILAEKDLTKLVSNL